jgi:hypothetical protein
VTGELCQKPECGRSAHTRGWCEPHYRHRLHTGRYGHRDASKVRAHVLALRELGWTYTQIAKEAEVSTWVPHKVATGAQQRVLEESERSILSLRLERYGSHRGVDGTGTFRRVEALQWMGWPLNGIGTRIGLKPYTLNTLRWRKEPVSYRVAHAIAVLYDELSHLPGPSKQTATKAKNRGYAPPAAWDEDTIDDPAAKPAGVRAKPRHRRPSERKAA